MSPLSTISWRRDLTFKWADSLNISSLINLSRPIKRRVFFVTDLCLVVLSLGCAFLLRYGGLGFDLTQSNALLLFPALFCASMVLFPFHGLPQIKLHTMESTAILRIAAVAAILAVLAIIFSYLLRLPTPRSVPLIFGALFFLSAVTYRVLGLRILTAFSGQAVDRMPVAIYGAGDAGVQLVTVLHRSPVMKPVALIDDNPVLQNMIVAGLHVRPPSILAGLVRRKEIKRVLLCMPSAPRDRINALSQEMVDLVIEVKVLPSFVELLSGASIEDSLWPVTPDALLGGNKVDLNIPEMIEAYADRVVMVTGAGGSIGSELCRQLIACAPARIILFDHSEKALQDVRDVLSPLAAQAGVVLVARLGSLVVPAQVAGVMTQEGVDVVLHAAAHIDARLVEDNPLEALHNNVLGTQVVADAAVAAGVGCFILLSANKTLRPVTVLDAAQRFAEWVVQDRQMRSDVTRFAIVRFGSVQAEAGSLIALFCKQIAAGGPVTVPHLEMSRRMMTVSHAARMILRSSTYAQGGEVFTLDPGSPQKIAEIARRTIEMSGRRVAEDAAHPNDIVLKVSGLRPGEALSEPPLAEHAAICGTPCAGILQITEVPRGEIEVASLLREIYICIAKADADRLRALVQEQAAHFHIPAAAIGQPAHAIGG